MILWKVGLTYCPVPHSNTLHKKREYRCSVMFFFLASFSLLSLVVILMFRGVAKL